MVCIIIESLLKFERAAKSAPMVFCGCLTHNQSTPFQMELSRWKICFGGLSTVLYQSRNVCQQIGETHGRALTLAGFCAKIFAKNYTKAMKETGGEGPGPREPAAGASRCQTPIPHPSRAASSTGRVPSGSPLVSDAGTPPLSGRVLLDMPEWVVQRSQAFVP